ncbi:hypothetical protein [Streptomyces zaehneri]|uniref:hypothetical protein n=1 Tax=Streptomyces zaehneri TaxID=3051180 RepID=UPI0028D09D72|nr:hypothetical protein [Streptomyces sp. DSM 40713]
MARSRWPRDQGTRASLVGLVAALDATGLFEPTSTGGMLKSGLSDPHTVAGSVSSATALAPASSEADSATIVTKAGA